MNETQPQPMLKQWITKELSILNIISIIGIPVAIGMGFNEYRTFKLNTETRLKLLEDNKDQVRDDVNEIKYNVRYITTTIEELKKSSDQQKRGR